MPTNLVMIQGNVARDVEMRGEVATFSIPTDESYQNKEGKKVEETEWHNCVAFGRLAEFASQWVKKSAKILVIGKLKTSEYRLDKHPGATFKKTEIIVRNIDMIVWPENKSDEEDTDTTTIENITPDVDDDDIPF